MCIIDCATHYRTFEFVESGTEVLQITVQCCSAGRRTKLLEDCGQGAESKCLAVPRVTLVPGASGPSQGPDVSCTRAATSATRIQNLSVYQSLASLVLHVSLSFG